MTRFGQPVIGLRISTISPARTPLLWLTTSCGQQSSKRAPSPSRHV
ncbi:MAG: hypothetical protein WD036_10370 [Bauldia sp.]